MSPTLYKGLSPAVADITRSQAQNRERERLGASLRAAFEADPLEDGVDHPAEKIIEEVLQSTTGRPVLEWLKMLSTDPARTGGSASLLRCLGRREGLGTAVWRAEIVRETLTMDNVEMRDAAVQAAESWGGPEMRAILQAHTEPEPWLGDYIRAVVDDLAE